MGSLEETETHFTLTLTVSLDTGSLQLGKVAALGSKRKLTVRLQSRLKGSYNLLSVSAAVPLCSPPASSFEDRVLFCLVQFRAPSICIVSDMWYVVTKYCLLLMSQATWDKRCLPSVCQALLSALW